jgi:hypothetical protein
MSQTRRDLDRKLSELEVRARSAPREYVDRHFLLDRTIGTVLTLIGMRMAWRGYRRRV